MLWPFFFSRLLIAFYVSKSKTDQLGKGYARTCTPTCPCALLPCHAALAQRNQDSLKFVFQNLSFFTSKGFSLRSIISSSYTMAREVVLDKFRAIDVDTSRMGLYSLRISGASAALKSGVNHHVIQKYGRWKSDSAKKLYCCESLRWQLLATSRIGLWVMWTHSRSVFLGPTRIFPISLYLLFFLLIRTWTFSLWRNAVT